jgi:hypothetical protein
VTGLATIPEKQLCVAQSSAPRARILCKDSSSVSQVSQSAVRFEYLDQQMESYPRYVAITTEWDPPW